MSFEEMGITLCNAVLEMTFQTTSDLSLEYDGVTCGVADTSLHRRHHAHLIQYHDAISTLRLMWGGVGHQIRGPESRLFISFPTYAKNRQLFTAWSVPHTFHTMHEGVFPLKETVHLPNM